MKIIIILINYFYFNCNFKITKGLDAAGKTTLLYLLKLGENVKTIPTIGFNVESFEFRQIQITMWDISGREKCKILNFIKNFKLRIF
jgi:hypothetical protein